MSQQVCKWGEKCVYKKKNQCPYVHLEDKLLAYEQQEKPRYQQLHQPTTNKNINYNNERDYRQKTEYNRNHQQYFYCIFTQNSQNDQYSEWIEVKKDDDNSFLQPDQIQNFLNDPYFLEGQRSEQRKNPSQVQKTNQNIYENNYHRIGLQKDEFSSLRVKFSIDRDSKNGKKQIRLLHQIMDEALFNADISLQFSHIQSQLFEQWKSAMDILHLVNIKIENDCQNDEDDNEDNDILNQSIVNSVLLGRVQKSKEKKIKTERIEFKQEQVYDFRPQEENNITAELRMILLHQQFFKMMPHEQNKIQIEVDGANNRYKFTSREGDSKVLYEIAKKIEKDLDLKVILLHQCSSKTESEKKLKCLLDANTKSQLLKIFNVKTCKIGITAQFNINDFNMDFYLKSSAKALMKENILYCIVDGPQNLQEKFDSLLLDKHFISKIIKNEKFSFKQKINVEEVKKKIAQLNSQHDFEDFYIGEIQIDTETKRYQIEVEIAYWLPYGCNFNEQLHMKIKETLLDLFVGTEIIKLSGKKLKLWENILSKKFDLMGKEMEISLKQKVVECSNNIKKKQFEIELQGSKEQIKIMAQLIDEDFAQNYGVDIVSVRENDEDILQAFSQGARSDSKAFKYDFQNIQQIIGSELIIKLKKRKNNDDQIRFQVFYEKQIKMDSIKEQFKQFVANLDKIKEKIEIKSFQHFCGEIPIEDLEEQFSVLLIKKDDYFIFCGTKPNIQQLKNQINQFKQQEENKFQQIQIDVESHQVFKCIIQKQNDLKQQPPMKDFEFLLNIDHQNQRIILRGKSEQIEQVYQYFQDEIEKIQQNIYSEDTQLNYSQIKFLRTKKSAQVQQLLTLHNCETIEKKVSSDKKKFLIEYDEKQLILIQGDIIKQEVDAIINSCNSQLTFQDLDQLSGVARVIAQAAGMQYQNECNQYINKYTELKVGEILITPSYNIKKCKYIFNVSAPLYQEGGLKYAEQIKLIEALILKIFQKANQQNITSLAIPILGGGAGGFYYQQISRIIIDTVCDQLFSKQNQKKRKRKISTVYIIEKSEDKIRELLNVFEDLLKPDIKLYQVQYQWQWEDNDELKDYDDWEINKQIDIAFQNYTQNPKLNEVTVKFPFSKLPGTHLVNLDDMTIQDIQLQTIQKISLQKANGMMRYHFDGMVQEDSITEFISLQKQKGQKQFQLFLKSHKIQFVSAQEIYQLNIKTGFKRKVFKTNLNSSIKDQFQIMKNPLKGKQVKTEDYSKEIVRKSTTLTVKGLDQLSVQKTIQELQLICQQNLISDSFQIPRVQKLELFQLINLMQNYSVELQGTFEIGQNIIVKGYKNQLEKIKDKIQLLERDESFLPSTWIPQTENFIKVTLKSTDEEYKKIYKQFKLTCSDMKIVQINRIQNKNLYRNYFQEKKDMINRNIQRKQLLEPEQQERLVWHGTRDSHPKSIYQGIQEAFDNTYSNPGGYWGMGIYFAENARYSVNYSHLLTQDEDPKLQGKHVFLCCLIASGKIFTCAPDSQLRRPPVIDQLQPELGQFDCVSGVTEGSVVYILYQMDVRRAYPAYEVIFERKQK